MSLSVDRRDALKLRHRGAILAAARALINERGGPTFTVDELAARADVARRTVFNHFASTDEILLTLCGDVLDVVIDDFIDAVAAAPVGDGSRASMFAEIAQTFRSADLPGVIADVVKILGGPLGRSSQALSDQAFARAGERLVDEVLRRNPGQDRLDAQLLVGSLMNGVMVISQHWVDHSGVRLDEEGRSEWQVLLTRLIDSVRSGYMPTP